MKLNISSQSNNKILLIGLDGATWDIIDPMLNKGQLPNLQRIIDGGTRATLRSLKFPASPRVWTSIATGKTEDKHGIMDFYSNLSQLKSKRIWDIFDDRGESSSVFYYFLTWPPKKNFNGIMIPGMLARDNRTLPENLSFIKDLELSEKMTIQEANQNLTIFRYLRNGFLALRNGVKVNTLLKAFNYKLISKMKNWSELDYYPRIQTIKLHFYTDIFSYILKKYPTDFATIIFPQADQICHKFWAYHEPDAFEKKIGQKLPQNEINQYGRVIPEIYQRLDQSIGKIINNISDDYTVLIVSDHGFGAIEELYSQLKIKGDYFIDKLGLKGVAHGVSVGAHFVIQIDDSINENKIDLIVNQIKKIKIIEDDKPFFNVEKSKNEISMELSKIFNVPVNESKALLKKHIRIGNDSIRASELLTRRSDITGDHRPNGILIMKGKNIRENYFSHEASVLDITPTILYLKNYPIARDMDGVVLSEIIDPDYFEKNPPQFIDTYETDEVVDDYISEGVDYSMTKEVEERLRGLGYIN